MLNKRTSTKFKNISENTNKIVDALLKNQAFLRWITHLVDYPLSSDISDVLPENILGDKLILTHFNPLILKEQEIKVFLTPHRGVPRKGGILADDIYEMNITMPNEWGYIYKTRVNRFGEIANIVAVTLDQQGVAGVGEVKVEINYNTYKINEAYTGMVLFITVTNSIMTELDI